jgi:conjugal transfer pilus assembly protein TraE
MREGRYRSLLTETVLRRNLWMLVALVMAASNLGLAYWVIDTDVREKTIVIPPLFEKPFWVHGDEVSPEYLEQMAVFFASLALTYNPDNIGHQVNLFLRHADPRGYGALAAKLEGDANRIRRNRLSSVFYPQEIRLSAQQAALTGQLTTLVGNKQTEQRQATFLIRFAYRSGRLFVSKFSEVQDSANPFTVDGAAAEPGS